MNLSAAVKIGLFTTLAWLAIVLSFWLFGPEGVPRSGLEWLGTAVGVILPVVLIWLAALTADLLTVLRAEADSLRLIVDSMRRDAAGQSAVRGEAAARRPAGAGTGTRSQTAIDPDQRQSQLDLGRDASRQQWEITPHSLILGLNFPNGHDDHPAIAALQAILAEPDLARVVRASQDVITLLAAKGIYMDDQAPDLPRPELWRRFAEGMRGGPVSGLAGVRNREVEAQLSEHLREDEILRDAVHHFLRQYDRMLTREVPRLDDAQLIGLSDTRSGRAFMLLARVAGVFG